MPTKLTPISATSADLATAHARRIVRSINDMASVLSTSYADHPATPAKASIDPATKQPRSIAARPACAKADIAARLGPANAALVETLLGAITPIVSPAPSAPAVAPAAAKT